MSSWPKTEDRAFKRTGRGASGISSTDPISVSDVVQKAFIGTEEAGTEAAAVAAEYLAGSALQTVPEFHCDRPFLVFIREETGWVLFAGLVVDPT